MIARSVGEAWKQGIGSAVGAMANSGRKTAIRENWTIGALIEELAGLGDAPAGTAVTSQGLATLSAAVLAERARALASGLIGIGVVPGEIVGLIAPNGLDWVVA